MAPEIIHVAVTLVAIPIVLILFQRFINKADDAKQKEEITWRKTVTDTFSRIEGKLLSYCGENRRAHDEIFNSRNDLHNRVSVIENIQHQRGCDQPYARRNTDG